MTSPQRTSIDQPAKRIIGAHHKIDGLVYERPEVMPPDPAVLSEERHERTFVRQQRARDVSWQNIAQQLQRCVLDVRRRHDPRWPG
ncbi:hypothetical protein [Brevundimonas subvibrioides]|uniref:Uncharacterized protein n=1 Tax=Brevundimonas subvibrioides (strain ATCC 15264 / DSM 4735 / LMG 14903 / NBRC 16000 / CB 81) TaxID=633149 RepID=D9QIA1_BRESC|nr:hypothetical protein [Brevundimonas subvibrioides]ADK99403.1 hypothetical protein Bresu_0089 [Brevundimonas subvibrioides ATCC 15264]